MPGWLPFSVGWSVVSVPRCAATSPFSRCADSTVFCEEAVEARLMVEAAVLSDVCWPGGGGAHTVRLVSGGLVILVTPSLKRHSRQIATIGFALYLLSHTRSTQQDQTQ